MEPPQLRRRPATGGYARGDEKRLRIVEAALQAFGAHGYEGASTRQIARDAGVNPPAIQYYFDGKEGLYEACADHVTKHFHEALQPAYRRAEGAEGDPAASVEALCDILDVLVQYLFETLRSNGWAEFLAREMGEKEKAYSKARSRPERAELHRRCNSLVAVAIGAPPSGDLARLRTVMIMGQVGAIYMNESSALEWLEWPDLRGERLRRFKEVLRLQTRAALR
jgi:TetR/AcrR family transcriptional regulator, regulator of cefoperazone and chloramphenicol sensitivity